MWVMMLISYITVSYIDSRGFIRLNDKKALILYAALMTLSCFIGTASGYASYMPSPSDLIKNFVLYIIR